MFKKIFLNSAFLILPLIFGMTSLFAAWQEDFLEKVEEQRFPSWMLEQVREDLAPYRQGITPELLEETIACSRRLKDSLFVRYEIRDQAIFSFADQETVNHHRFQSLTNSLNALAQCIKLPNLTFLVSLHDSFDHLGFKGPLLVFAKDRNIGRTNILIPDEAALTGNLSLLTETVQGNRDFPWQKKINKAFWRGTTTGGFFTLSSYTTFPRYQLVKVAEAYPELLDAKFSGFAQYENSVLKELEKYKGSYETVHEHLKYKYQILADGNTSAWTRAIWQLFSNSVIFKQESPNIQWFYRALVPYVHYIPIANDFSDLPAKIEWAKANDQEAFKIMLQAHHFAQSNLQHSDIFLYLYLVLTELAKLL